MADLIEEFTLPSKGKIYDKPVNGEGRIRAPRLCDKGIGDLSRKNKIQAETLNKTILDPGLGIDAYDLHTSDYTYLNLKQRIVSKGKNMDLIVRCPRCGQTEKIEVDLDEVKITEPKLPLDLDYTTRSGEQLKLRFITPRILDQIKVNTAKFKDEFPEATQDVSLQETCRAIIVTVDGEKKSYSQMTNYLLNSYEVDLKEMVDKVVDTAFGPVLIKKHNCKCGYEFSYSISPDNG